MDRDDGGEALDEVARLRPAVDRLRELLTSATVLDLKASTRRYWADRWRDAGPGSAERPAAV